MKFEINNIYLNIIKIKIIITDDDDGDLRAEAAREEIRPVAVLRMKLLN